MFTVTFLSLRYVAFLLLLSSSLILLGVKAAPTKANFEIVLLFNNDMHARFEQTGKAGNECQPSDVMSNKCYGGFARVAHKVREYRQKAAEGGPPVLYLNAGDTYTGTPWFTLYKDNITAAFMNILKPDAISLGNHEFDEGVEGLTPFLNEIDFPVLVSNLDLSSTPQMQNISSLKNSIVFDINNVKIGVIGYLTPETAQLAIPNSVGFFDEIESINKEAAILKKQGINIIIALGHSGLERDKVIAASCPDIDIVIGGHSHSFLYTGTPPDIEQPVDKYPVEVKNPKGKTVPVVQAFCYTKYLGYLKLEFNKKGDLLKYDGTPLLLDGTIPRDDDVLTLLNFYRPGLEALESRNVGETKVLLDFTRCRFEECNIGNMVADAYVQVHAWNYSGKYWTDAAIGLIQGGGIRSSIAPENGTIFMKDLMTTLPFNADMMMVNVTGSIVKEMFERSVERWDNRTGRGEFLQVSGVRVVYNLTMPAGERVRNIEVRCADCSIPKFQAINMKSTYKIITSNFIVDGGDGYTMLIERPKTQLNQTDIEMVELYLNKTRPVYPAIEWRITMTGKPEEEEIEVTTTKPGGGNASHIKSSILIVLITAIINLLK